jgi:hypothetical protein
MDKLYLQKISKYLDKYVGLMDSPQGNFGVTTPVEVIKLESTVRSLVDNKFMLYHTFALYNQLSKDMHVIGDTTIALKDDHPSEEKLISTLEKAKDSLSTQISSMTKLHIDGQATVGKLTK